MRVNEQGRSMIEMLGVLAIVGVLSVGGIAGYSKAMNKFKTNKVIDQINMISTNIRTLFSSQNTYSGLNHAVLINAAVIPAEMYDKTAAISSTTTITHAFGGEVKITTSTYNGQANAAYVIAFNNVPKASCVTLATTDWGGDVGSGFAGMYVKAGDTVDAATTAVASVEGSTTGNANLAIPGDQSYGTPVNVVTAQGMCTDNANNAFALKYI